MNSDEPKSEQSTQPIDNLRDVDSTRSLGADIKEPTGWNPDYLDRHSLLVHISKRHKEWIEDARVRKTDLVRGISIGNAMALEELHAWVKAWTPSPTEQGTPARKST